MEHTKNSVIIEVIAFLIPKIQVHFGNHYESWIGISKQKVQKWKVSLQNWRLFFHIGLLHMTKTNMTYEVFDICK